MVMGQLHLHYILSYATYREGFMTLIPSEAFYDDNLLILICRSRALSTKYNSTPEQASRPFDCDRDGFV